MDSQRVTGRIRIRVFEWLAHYGPAEVGATVTAGAVICQIKE